MELGAFSVSLAVQDIAASRTFYENLGFEVTGGDQEQNWLILRNGTTTLGLFQGMFDNNIFTFNPGWDSQAEPLPEFTDVRAIQQRLSEANVDVGDKIDAQSEGPASFMVTDPDGNQILFDQHR